MIRFRKRIVFCVKPRFRALQQQKQQQKQQVLQPWRRNKERSLPPVKNLIRLFLRIQSHKMCAIQKDSR